MSNSLASISPGGETRPPAGEPYLFLVFDGNRPLAPVSRHSLSNVDEVHIGRASERLMQRETKQGVRSLFLRYPDPWMSTLHARLQRTDKGLMMTDPGSKNGSFVNGSRLSSAVLTDGDILRFGHTFFIYRADLVPQPNEELDEFPAPGAPLGLATMLAPLSRSFLSFGRAAIAGAPLLLEGEPGTGKSLLARSAHALSGRGGGLVTLTANGLADDVFERRLRGTEDLAVDTGEGLGALLEARGGTLLLENVDTLSLRSQLLLSRILHEGVVAPMGSGPAMPLECNIVSTSTHNLDELVAHGHFESQLASLLTGHRLVLPPLRHRREDIGLLVATMLEHYAPPNSITFSADAVHALLSYSWPRNLRELESCIGTALAWRNLTVIEVSHLPPEFQNVSGGDDKQVSGDTIDTVELVQQDLDKRANIIAEMRARTTSIFNNRETIEQVRGQFERWLARTDRDFFKKKNDKNEK